MRVKTGEEAEMWVWVCGQGWRFFSNDAEIVHTLICMYSTRAESFLSFSTGPRSNKRHARIACSLNKDRYLTSPCRVLLRSCGFYVLRLFAV